MIKNDLTHKTRPGDTVAELEILGTLENTHDQIYGFPSLLLEIFLRKSAVNQKLLTERMLDCNYSITMATTTKFSTTTTDVLQ